MNIIELSCNKNASLVTDKNNLLDISKPIETFLFELNNKNEVICKDVSANITYTSYVVDEIFNL